MSFLVMEYLEGLSLSQELATPEALSLHDGLEVLRSVVEAFTYAHDHGIIHPTSSQRTSS
jgi:serine/threonine protein kinase